VTTRITIFGRKKVEKIFQIFVTIFLQRRRRQTSSYLHSIHNFGNDRVVRLSLKTFSSVFFILFNVSDNKNIFFFSCRYVSGIDGSITQSFVQHRDLSGPASSCFGTRRTRCPAASASSGSISKGHGHCLLN